MRETQRAYFGDDLRAVFQQRAELLGRHFDPRDAAMVPQPALPKSGAVKG